MQEHYERLLQKAKDELEVLREWIDMTQNWYVCCPKHTKNRVGTNLLKVRMVVSYMAS